MDTVSIPNKLINASYSMPIRAMRLRTLALARLTPLNYITGDSPVIRITAQEWQEAFPESEQPYRDIEIAARDFEKAHARFSGETTAYKFLNSTRYLKGEGAVLLEFNPQFLLACVSEN